MDKIAIISDVHGNLEAMNTVLADIRMRGIQRIFCLGDTISKGAHEQECVDLVRENCEVVIQGNCDKFYILDPATMEKERDQKHAKWIQSKLTREAMGYIRDLPFCHEFYMSGRLVRLLHAHPVTSNKAVGNIDKIEHFYELVLPSERTASQEKADVVVYGHIHTPFAQKIYNRLILNPGSVGDALDGVHNSEKDTDPRFTTVANYLILKGAMDSREASELSFEFVNLPYDVEKELEANADNPERAAYECELREGRYRTMDKVYKMYEARGIDPSKI